jgi:succinyl-CoA synthetase beta subunit
LHKSDIGGVELNLTDEQQVKSAYDRIMQASKRVPNAKIEGVLISPMRVGGIELIVGVVRDAQWGPMLVLGLGGIFVEILGDSVIVPLPTSADRVGKALSTLRGAPLLDGVRGTRAADKKALCEVIVKIGELAGALGDSLDTLEVNPLVINGSDIEALDALVTWQQ